MDLTNAGRSSRSARRGADDADLGSTSLSRFLRFFHRGKTGARANNQFASPAIPESGEARSGRNVVASATSCAQLAPHYGWPTGPANADDIAAAASGGSPILFSKERNVKRIGQTTRLTSKHTSVRQRERIPKSQANLPSNHFFELLPERCVARIVQLLGVRDTSALCATAPTVRRRIHDLALWRNVLSACYRGEHVDFDGSILCVEASSPARTLLAAGRKESAISRARQSRRGVEATLISDAPPIADRIHPFFLVAALRRAAGYKCGWEDVLETDDSLALLGFVLRGECPSVFAMGWAARNHHALLLCAMLRSGLARVYSRAHVLCSDPVLLSIPNFLTLPECDLLVKISEPKFRRSQVTYGSSGQVSKGRTSFSASLDSEEGNGLVGAIERRIALVAGFDHSHVECLQVVRYLPGQQYKVHRDYIRDDGSSSQSEREKLEMDGQRVSSMVIYLNHVPQGETGGSTYFASLDIRIRPEKGKAAFWNNVNRKTGLGNPRTEHAGEMPIVSTKYVLTAWVRSKPQYN